MFGMDNSSTGALSSSQVSISIQLYPHLMKSFWFRINISDCCLVVVWSLVTIAAERYLAVCQPFKHNEFTTRKVLLFYVVIYFMAAFINSTAALEVSSLHLQLIQNWFSLNFLIVGTPSSRLILNEPEPVSGSNKSSIQ